MTERYAKLGRGHIARAGNTARELWKLLDQGTGEEKRENETRREQHIA
jgi:hypothetical protein